MIWQVILLFFIGLQNCHGFDRTCTQEGQCIHSFGLGSKPAARFEEKVQNFEQVSSQFVCFSTEDCYFMCRAKEGCTDFSYLGDGGICSFFQGCQELSTDTCELCVSGSLEGCDACSVQGEEMSRIIQNVLDEIKVSTWVCLPGPVWYLFLSLIVQLTVVYLAHPVHEITCFFNY